MRSEVRATGAVSMRRSPNTPNNQDTIGLDEQGTRELVLAPSSQPSSPVPMTPRCTHRQQRPPLLGIHERLGQNTRISLALEFTHQRTREVRQAPYAFRVAGGSEVERLTVVGDGVVEVGDAVVQFVAREERVGEAVKTGGAFGVGVERGRGRGRGRTLLTELLVRAGVGPSGDGLVDLDES